MSEIEYNFFEKKVAQYGNMPTAHEERTALAPNVQQALAELGEVLELMKQADPETGKTYAYQDGASQAIYTELEQAYASLTTAANKLMQDLEQRSQQEQSEEYGIDMGSTYNNDGSMGSMLQGNI